MINVFGEQYTRTDWQWWQIISSFARIKEVLEGMKMDSFTEDDERKVISELKEKITKLIANMRGEL